jgi:hypothetical protein
MPEDVEESKPPFPPGMTRSHFGSRVMQWGTGYEPAVARKDTIALAWLVEHGVTLAMVRAWRRFYEETYAANPANSSAKGRAELMSHCEQLFEEQDGDASADNAN